jgi:molybdopterin molybdotransferase
MTGLAAIVSCLDGYDPESLHVDVARAAIGACLEPVAEEERVPVREALGRVLSRELVSPVNVPAHDNSAMDGWAVRAADLAPDRETALTEIGVAYAGRPFAGEVRPGECVRVMTGAVMPRGADTVVIQEIVRAEGGRVLVPPGQKPEQNVRRAGEDVRAGAPALKAGTRIGAAELGLIASLGVPEVCVRRRLRVAFFSTGDELTSVGEPLAAGGVYDSNRYTLAGMLAPLGAELADLGVVRDDPAALEQVLRTAAESADAIITTGGVSVGEADFVRALMAKLGEVLFWKIAMRPGRPMAFGRLGTGRRPFLFGLPGNPVAVMVTFHQFVRGALLRLAGCADHGAPPLLEATAASAIRKIPGRTEYQRGIVYRDKGRWMVRTTGSQGSGVLRSMVEANCYIVLEHERGAVQAGEPVSVQLLAAFS